MKIEELRTLGFYCGDLPCCWVKTSVGYEDLVGIGVCFYSNKLYEFFKYGRNVFRVEI